VIESFRDEATRRLWAGERVRGFGSLNLELARERLDILNAATSLADIPALRSVHLHPLKGGRRGQWSISINGRWRICFEFRAGHAYNVEVADYHEG
jgi:proteic killer suppression protein